ncbi:MAG: hypothetical protein KKH34_11925 [Candidatus Omnitrophica bacterium]|nr:hypothetical protein [Candidatus Omnitrophota bacterium]
MREKFYRQKNEIRLKLIALIIIQSFILFDVCWAGNGVLAQKEESLSKSTLSPHVSISEPDFQRALLAQAREGSSWPESLPRTSGKAQPKVRFEFSAPAAQSVFLIGDFSNWQVSPRFAMRQGKDRDGVWSISVPGIEAGMKYKFVVDGDWQLDPRKPSYPDSPSESANYNHVVTGEDIGEAKFASFKAESRILITLMKAAGYRGDDAAFDRAFNKAKVKEVVGEEQDKPYLFVVASDYEQEKLDIGNMSSQEIIERMNAYLEKYFGSREEITDEDIEKFKRKEAFSWKTEEEEARIEKIAGAALAIGLSGTEYQITNIKRFSSTSPLAYMEYLETLVERYNGNLVVFLSVESPDSLKGDMAGMSTAYTAVEAKLGREFLKEKKKKIITDGGEKSRGGNWPGPFFYNGLMAAPNGPTYYELAMATLRKVMVSHQGHGEGRVSWTASDGDYEIRGLNYANLPVGFLGKDDKSWDMMIHGQEEALFEQDMLDQFKTLLQKVFKARDAEVGALESDIQEEQDLQKRVKQVLEKGLDKDVASTMEVLKMVRRRAKEKEQIIEKTINEKMLKKITDSTVGKIVPVIWEILQGKGLEAKTVIQMLKEAISLELSNEGFLKELWGLTSEIEKLKQDIVKAKERQEVVDEVIKNGLAKKEDSVGKILQAELKESQKKEEKLGKEIDEIIRQEAEKHDLLKLMISKIDEKKLTSLGEIFADPVSARLIFMQEKPLAREILGLLSAYNNNKIIPNAFLVVFTEEAFLNQIDCLNTVVGGKRLGAYPGSYFQFVLQSQFIPEVLNVFPEEVRGKLQKLFPKERVIVVGLGEGGKFTDRGKTDTLSGAYSQHLEKLRQERGSQKFFLGTNKIDGKINLLVPGGATAVFEDFKMSTEKGVTAMCRDGFYAQNSTVHLFGDTDFGKKTKIISSKINMPLRIHDRGNDVVLVAVICKKGQKILDLNSEGKWEEIKELDIYPGETVVSITMRDGTTYINRTLTRAPYKGISVYDYVVREFDSFEKAKKAHPRIFGGMTEEDARNIEFITLKNWRNEKGESTDIKGAKPDIDVRRMYRELGLISSKNNRNSSNLKGGSTAPASVALRSLRQGGVMMEELIGQAI